MISTTAEYALRATVYLAQYYGQAKTSSEIAGATRVPIGYLSKIMQMMGKRRLVTAQRGLGGGFQLARDPQDISVLDVMRAVDSPLQRIDSCPLGLKSHVNLCPLHRLVDDAIAHVEQAFAAASIAKLARSARGVPPLCEMTEEDLSGTAGR